MAAAVDLKSQATFPIRLGASILKHSPSTATTQYTSVQYNHKPSLKHGASVTATISEGDAVGESKLSIKDQDDEYKYNGTYGQDQETYVLVIRGKEGVLERMGSVHGFNLVGDKYPPLPEEGGEDDLFGDEDEADKENPFDYRHFLKGELEKPEVTSGSLDAGASRSSATGTPLVKPRPTPSTSASKPVAKRPETKPEPLRKRKAPAKANNAKRVKAGQEPAPPPAPKPKARPEVPKINLDRKASLRRPSLDDSGELILENETPITEKPPKLSAMAQALQGQLGSGPISLRSAANSPGGSHIASPAPQRPADVEEEYVFEFDDEPEPEKEDDADEEDGDVEDLELPSPVQNKEPNSATSASGAGDDEDDLDKQLALAMMEEDDGGAGEQQESEEESEEE